MAVRIIICSLIYVFTLSMVLPLPVNVFVVELADSQNQIRVDESVDESPATTTTTEKPLTKIIDYEKEDTETGNHLYYRLSDGQWRNDTIVIMNAGTDAEEVIHQGAYGFKGTDGYLYKIIYYADKTGYHATVHRYLRTRISPNLIKSLVG